MEFEGVTVSQLGTLVEETNEAISKVGNETVKAQLIQFKRNLSDMRVALSELDHLEEEFKRGNVMSELYFDRHKKLIRDFFTAKDGIAQTVLPRIIDSSPTEEGKSKLHRLMEYLRGNKDLFLNLSQLLVSIIQLFGK